MTDNSVLMIFIDGVGIGKNDPVKNPFIKYNFKIFSNHFTSVPHLDNLYGKSVDSIYFPVDACMGIEGIPQSGTGQTSIFCGFNAAEFLGKHFGPFPHTTLYPLIKEKNIFKEVIVKGLKSKFVNAYPQMFFDYLKSGRQRLSFTTLTSVFNETSLCNLNDLRKGRAISAEIDNSRWRNKLNYNLPVIKPETAAKRLIKIASENNFTLFEYYLTDHFGHLRHQDYLEYAINILDSFLLEILNKLPREMTFILCSDHGNFEDLSNKSHTLNPSLCIVSGKHSQKLADSIKSLEHIKSSILEILK